MGKQINYDVNNIDIKTIVDQIDYSKDCNFSNENSQSENNDLYGYEINFQSEDKVEDKINDELYSLDLKRIILFEGNIEKHKGFIGFIKYTLKRLVRKSTHKFFEELAFKQTEFNNAVYAFLVKKYMGGCENEQK